LARDPSADETKTLLEYLDRKSQEGEDKLRPAYEDIVWTLINTKEFLFNH
jgi:hypothetical protein